MIIPKNAVGYTFNSSRLVRFLSENVQEPIGIGHELFNMLNELAYVSKRKQDRS